MGPSTRPCMTIQYSLRPAPTMQFRILPIADVSGRCHAQKINHVIRRCHLFARKYTHGAEVPPHRRFWTQLTVYAIRRTPHGASRLVHAMSAWSMKTRRAPSRHCRDARVNGPMDYTAVHGAMLPPHLTPFASRGMRGQLSNAYGKQ